MAFWNAALISAWLLLMSTAKCRMKLLQAADDALASTAVKPALLSGDEPAGRNPKFMPAAEAVTMTAAPATATAPAARPATRR